MGLIFSKKENPNPQIEELKKQFTGENAGKPKETTKQKNEKDDKIFAEEQKLFNRINTSIQLNTSVNYEIPKELAENETEKEKNEESAFNKLLKMASKENNEPKPSEKSIYAEKNPEPIIKAEKQAILSEEKPKIILQKKDSLEKQQTIMEGKASTSEQPITYFAKHKKVMDAQHEMQEKQTIEKTPIDEMFEIIEKYSKLDIGEIANYLQITEEQVTTFAKMFEADGTIEIEYPTSLTKKPLVILKKPYASKLANIPSGETMEEYELEVDNVSCKILIIRVPEEARPVYAIEMPHTGKYTKKFLEFIKDEVAETMPIELEEITDPKKSKILKKRFFAELNEHLKKYLPKASEKLLNMLSGTLLHEMYGLGDIELLMGDDMLEEVSINSAKTPITIYHRIHGWLKTNLMPGTEEEINNFSSQIGRKVGREITMLNPILDAHMLSGDRVNATLFPISSEGNTITIRRFARRPWTLIDFIGKAHTMNSEMAAILWLAMQYEMNVLIAGGTASGKTSTLNTLLALVPTYHRIISIEDVREIVLPKYLEWNWVPLITRNPNPEGLGEVTMLDLMITSLRMRPDRIIVGEIRRKKEAEVLMEAIETGHSIYSTIHANSGYQVLRRLAEAPIAIPLMQIELIDLIVVQYRDRKTNKRRTYEIAEIEQTSTGQGLQINNLYKWNPRTDSWEKLNKPTKLITLLNMHTGMTEDDIYNEINERQNILEWMKRNELTELNTIGYLVKLFYSNPEKVKKMAKQNTKIEEVQKLQQESELIETTKEN
jgi:flagellar protein FlaI